MRTVNDESLEQLNDLYDADVQGESKAEERNARRNMDTT